MSSKEFEETLRSWNELKQGKMDRINEPLSSEEEELINPLSNSILSLVRGYVVSTVIDAPLVAPVMRKEEG